MSFVLAYSLDVVNLGFCACVTKTVDFRRIRLFQVNFLIMMVGDIVFLQKHQKSLMLLVLS